MWKVARALAAGNSVVMARMLLPDERHDEFVDKLIERANAIQLGDTRGWETDVGPLVSAEQQQFSWTGPGAATPGRTTSCSATATDPRARTTARAHDLVARVVSRARRTLCARGPKTPAGDKGGDSGCASG